MSTKKRGRKLAVKDAVGAYCPGSWCRSDRRCVRRDSRFGAGVAWLLPPQDL
jgi:hypothetical protein